MAYKWKRQTIEKLVMLVQHYDCIYNVCSAEYLDRTKKAEAFREIWLQLRDELHPRVTAEDVKKKWANLRIQFVAERRHLLKSKKKGTTADEPKFWCFEQLSFLTNHTQLRSSRADLEKRRITSTNKRVHNHDHREGSSKFVTEYQEAYAISSDNSDNEISTPQKSMKLEPDFEVVDQLSNTCDFLSENDDTIDFVDTSNSEKQLSTTAEVAAKPTTIHTSEESVPQIVRSIADEDEFFYFGLSVAAQLRNIPLKQAYRLQAKIQSLLSKEKSRVYRKRRISCDSKIQ